MKRPLFGRIFLSALLFDGSFYMVGTLIPLKAVSLGASAFQLGLMPVLGAGSYIAAALLGGHLSDRWPRITLARWGAALRALVTLLLFLTGSTAHLLLVLPLFGLVNGLFWPGIQAALPSLAPGRELGALVGRFNVSWSAGKMLGFALGGVLVDRVGYGLPIWIATVAGGAPALLLPTERTVAQAGARVAGDDRTPTAGSAGSGGAVDGAVWRRVGWTANFLLFGVGATLNYHYPKLLHGRGLGGTEFGIFLGLAYLVQTAAFVLFGRWGGWHFRARWLLGAELLVAGALVVLPGVESPWVIWSLAPAIGLGLGLAYSSSLFYSLLGPGAPGRSTGLHEAILASGSFLLPFLAGMAVRMSGDLRIPYVFAAGVVVVGVAIQGSWLARGRAGPNLQRR